MPISEMMTLRGALTDPRDGRQRRRLRDEREAGLVNAGVQAGDHVREVVDVLQMQGAHQCVLGAEAAGAGQPQVRDLAAHLASRRPPEQQ